MPRPIFCQHGVQKWVIRYLTHMIHNISTAWAKTCSYVNGFCHRLLDQPTPKKWQYSAAITHNQFWH